MHNGGRERGEAFGNLPGVRVANLTQMAKWRMIRGGGDDVKSQLGGSPLEQ